MRRTVRYLTLLPLILAFACSAPTRRSTASSRIEKNKKLFHTYPPSVQRAICSGQIQQGFDRNKVYLALGKATRKEAAGASETWLYAKPVRKKATTRNDVSMDATRVVRIVRFTDGRVSSWEVPPAP